MAECLGNENIDDYPICKNILPVNYEYKMCSYNEESSSIYNQCQFTAVLRTRSLTKESVKQWLDEYSRRSRSTFRVDRTHKPGCRTIFKVQYRCQHNTRPRKNSVPHAKHTKCNAKLTINVKNVKRPDLSRDKYLPEFPTVIMLRHTHNHPLYKPESLKFSDPAPEVRERFLQLFCSGHNVTSAYNIYKSDVLESYENSDYERIINDRGLIPNTRWIRYLYDKIFIKGNMNSAVNISAKLADMIRAYNIKCNDQCALLVQEENSQFVGVVCSPLMKKSHQLANLKRFLFVESSVSNRFLCKVYVLQTHSIIGGLPVGVLIISFGLKNGLVKALKLYIDLLPKNCFGDKGASSGPSYIITNNLIDQEAFLSIFKNSVVLPSVYHQILSVWKFLCNTQQQNIPLELLPRAYLLIKFIFSSTGSTELSKNYDNVCAHPLAEECPFFLQYLQQLYQNQKNDFLNLRGPDKELVSDIMNSSFEVYHDQVLLRTKAVDPLQLFEFVTDLMEEFYLCRMECAILGQENEWFLNEFREVSLVAASRNLVVDDIDSEEFLFKVSNNASGDYYLVDSRLGFCSCFIGRSGAKCSHQLAIRRDRDLLKCDFQKLRYDLVAQKFYQKVLLDCGRIMNNFSYLKNGPNVLTSYVRSKRIVVSDGNLAHLMFNPSDVPNTLSAKERAKSNLKSIYEDLQLKLDNNSEEFIPAVNQFAASYKKLNSDYEKTEALTNFANNRTNIQNVVLFHYDS